MICTSRLDNEAAQTGQGAIRHMAAKPTRRVSAKAYLDDRIGYLSAFGLKEVFIF
jgi:hypothetical protein